MKAEQTNARNILPRLPQGAGSNLKSYSPTQLHFLMRLPHLQRQPSCPANHDARRMPTSRLSKEADAQPPTHSH